MGEVRRRRWFFVVEGVGTDACVLLCLLSLAEVVVWCGTRVGLALEDLPGAVAVEDLPGAVAVSHICHDVSHPARAPPSIPVPAPCLALLRLLFRGSGTP